MRAWLALEDGTTFQGRAAGADGESAGEVVFNTSLTGYQEILTDPSYAGQIVTMTCPEIGNYGVSAEDIESRRPAVAGFVIRDESPIASNWRAVGTLRDYLTRHAVVAISDIDTRALTRRLRSAGVMRGVIATGDLDPAVLVERARAARRMEGADLVRDVTCDAPYDWPLEDATTDISAATGVAVGFTVPAEGRATQPFKVAAYDFGMKWNIVRRLTTYGCEVRVFPAAAEADAVLAARPDGVFLSNGPGDPAAVGYAIENVRKIVAAGVSVFGICLGHQILALALGARTYKLKFGHRGANHPVKQIETGQVEITSQNHGFAVDPDSLPASAAITHINLYDGTVEGLRDLERPAFSVQYHPEASPGPHDADYLFRRFIEMMERNERPD
jgi:carbamoyl-phosphate synthase small subunit